MRHKTSLHKRPYLQFAAGFLVSGGTIVVPLGLLYEAAGGGAIGWPLWVQLPIALWLKMELFQTPNRIAKKLIADSAGTEAATLPPGQFFRYGFMAGALDALLTAAAAVLVTRPGFKQLAFKLLGRDMEFLHIFTAIVAPMVIEVPLLLWATKRGLVKRELIKTV